MIRTPFPVSWYGCAAVRDSGYGVLYPDNHVATHRGHIALPPGGNTLFVVTSYVEDLFCMACQGGSDGYCWVWNGLSWWRLVDPISGLPFLTYGTSPCAFGPLGLYVSIQAASDNVRVVNPVTGQPITAFTQALGVRGISTVDSTGRVWSVDECYGHNQLGEFVPVHEDLYIGQGIGPGGCHIKFNGVLYELEPTEAEFIRVQEQDGHLAVAMWKRSEKQCVCHWLTEAEIPLLPKVVVPVPPVPVPPPVIVVPPPIIVPPVPHFPPLKTTERYWLGPNIDSADLVDLVENSLLPTVDVLALPVQWILEDRRWDQLASLRELRAQSLNLAVEMGSIKPGDLHAENAQADLLKVSNRVVSKGHRVNYLTMDEPLTATKQTYVAGKLTRLDQPVQPLEESVFAVAKFVAAAREAMPGVKVGWAEAWPEIDLEDQRHCLMGLDRWGCHLDYWHLDVDWHRAHKEGLNPYDVIRLAKSYADDYHLQLGVYLAGYPHLTDADYYNEVLVMAEDLHAEASWCVDHVLVQSWATRGEGGPQDLPANLLPAGLLQLFQHVQIEVFP